MKWRNWSILSVCCWPQLVDLSWFQDQTEQNFILFWGKKECWVQYVCAGGLIRLLNSCIAWWLGDPNKNFQSNLSRRADGQHEILSCESISKILWIMKILVFSARCASSNLGRIMFDFFLQSKNIIEITKNNERI